MRFNFYIVIEYKLNETQRRLQSKKYKKSQSIYFKCIAILKMDSSILFKLKNRISVTVTQYPLHH